MCLNRFYAIADSALANYKLPYIIVDQAPKSSETFSDFVLLKEQYEWDEETYKHLLPGFSIPNRWQESSYSCGKERSKEDALSQIEQLVSELQKKDSYLPEPTSLYGNNTESSKNEIKKIKVLPSQKKVLFEFINSIKESVIKHNKYNPMDELFSNYDNMTEEEEARLDYYIEQAPWEWHHFALGIKYDDGIVWHILYTNEASGSYEKVEFDLTLKSIELKSLISQPLNRLGTQIITQDMFFGRGRFSKRLNSKRIALVGLGAIGVEFFLTKQGEVIFSELSPRPHDTGMVTLGHTTNLSEFELHFRAVMGLPIAGIHLEHAGASAVILSPVESNDPLPYNLVEALKEDHTRIRIFGKPEAHVGRRMGVTLCYGEPDADTTALRDKAKRLAATVLGTDPYMEK